MRSRDPYDGQLMTKQEKFKMCALINELVDLSENISEEEEQVIFEFAVDKIVRVLSEDLTPIHHAMVKGHHTPLPDAMVEMMSTRLFERVDTAVRLPFLDAVDEARVKRSVIALVMRAMATDDPIEDIVELKNAKPIIVDILSKGIANVFFDPKERQNLVEALSVNIKNVPFVPVGLVNTVLDWCVCFVGDHILNALTVTTDECLDGAKGDLGAAYSESHKQGAYAAVCLVEIQEAQRLEEEEEEESEEEEEEDENGPEDGEGIASDDLEHAEAEVERKEAVYEKAVAVATRARAKETDANERVLVADIEASADDGGGGDVDANEVVRVPHQRRPLGSRDTSSS